MQYIIYGLIALFILSTLKSKPESFRYVKTGRIWRIYFRIRPSSISHVLHDNNGYYICWSDPIPTRKQAKTVAAMWRQQYGSGKSGKARRFIAFLLTIFLIFSFLPPDLLTWTGKNLLSQYARIERSISLPTTPTKPSITHPKKPGILSQKNSVLATMDRKDRQTLIHYFQTKPVNSTDGWKNRTTGLTYRVTVLGFWYVEGDNRCAHARIEGITKEWNRKEDAISCRSDQGQWSYKVFQ